MEKTKAGVFNPLPIVPIALIGANVNEKPNYLAVGCIGAVNLNPPIMMISLNKTHYTPTGIAENKTFSINIPSTALVKETDYCGLKSGKTTDKSEIFTTFYGDLETAPMIQECPITCECRVIDSQEFPQCIAYYGEVHQVYFNVNLIKDKKFNIININPVIFSALENVYRDLGESKKLGQCYKVGWEYEKSKASEVIKRSKKEPKIVEKEQFQILGVQDISKMESREPAAVWARFQQVGSQIPHADTSHALGIYMSNKKLRKEGKNRYIVGVEVSKVEDIPKGMISESIPSQKYALFTHTGPLSTLKNTHQYINEQWLPNNPRYERVPFGVELEWYDSRFRFDSEYSELDLYIPIQEKSE
jgi:flavin reductase (DIM6/NTAB) family NADH-FMN oxidoreductase RutF/predicted transcriptional regulator YdeE